MANPILTEATAPVQRLLIDVDTGTDDALALIYALQQKNTEMIGITTGTGNTSAKQATVNTLRLLQMMNATGIPVIKGAHQPLRREWLGPKTDFHGQDGLGDYPWGDESSNSFEAAADNSENDQAAHFIVQQVNRYPGELTFVSLGRLTNLALAFQLDPSLERKIREVVLMGGAYAVPGNIRPTAETNIYNDPEAAEQIFSSSVPLTMVGLDVTTKALFTPLHMSVWEDRISSRSAPVIKLIRHLFQFRMGAYQRKKDIFASPLHDPLAVAIALDPELAVTKRIPLYVELEQEHNLGATLPLQADTEKSSQRRPVKVCVDVNAEKFIQRFIYSLSHFPI
ncbi:nucleoside hydrolase [Paenibacillus jiagnxiensis]|uniref:nucleoside hydrolase n=1 Tax=Paenibacillus jiagnxiensis TaxID=3228926 RepID=UPI0033B07808